MRIDSYKEFRQSRVIKEEFIAKAWRNLTGENKKRIEEVRSICLGILKAYFDIVMNEDIGDINAELKYPYFLEAYKRIVELAKIKVIKGLESQKEVNDFVNNLMNKLAESKSDDYSISSSALDTLDFDFVKSLDKSSNIGFGYEDFIKLLNNILDQVKICGTYVYEKAFIKNYENILEQKIKLLDEISRLKEVIKSKKLFYYYSNISLYREKDWYVSHVARFVKSLVLPLSREENGKTTDICDDNLIGYDDGVIGSETTWSYDDEYGIEYLDKLDKDILEKKVSELERFKELMSEVNELKSIFEEFYQKLDYLEKRIEKANNTKEGRPSFVSNTVIYRIYGIGETNRNDTATISQLRQNIDYKIKELNLKDSGIVDPYDLHTGSDGLFVFNYDTGPRGNYGGRTYFYLVPKDRIELFERFTRDYSSQEIKTVLSAGNDKFSTIPMIIIQDREDPRISFEDGKRYSGNILYHGSIHYRLDQPGEIEKLIYKRSPYKARYAGLGVYCTIYASAACQYAYLRGTKGAISDSSVPDSIKAEYLRSGSDYFPTIYKFTIKPGSKFEYLKDTTMESDEFYNLKKIGLQGIHSGTDEVSGGNTQETCIIDPECIIKVEKLKPSDVIGLDDTLWSRGSDLTKKDFIDWYKELIDKRKKSKER
jgi:hypothetical protein